VKKFFKDLIRAYELRIDKYPLFDDLIRVYYEKYPPGKPAKRLENTKSAIELYKKMMHENGENPDILDAIATCYTSWADIDPDDYPKWDDAISTMLRAIELSPDNGYLHAVLASYYYFGKTEIEKAVIEYKKAIELNPNDIWALNNLAGLFDNPENVITIQEAIRLRERVLSIQPIEPLNHALLAELYCINRQFGEAQDEAIKSLLCVRPLPQGWLEKIKDILEKISNDTDS
jgi:tetratricopeptide (TPR) repeat protein